MTALRNIRDEHNWMVPRDETIRRRVYDMLVAGSRTRDILEGLGLSRPAFNNHAYFIKHWERANAFSLATKKR